MSLKVSFNCLASIAICLLSHSTSLADVADDRQQPFVQTTTATIRGKRLEIRPHQLPDEFHRSVSAFTRIPYAEPPVGDRRFARPVARAPMSGDVDATRDSVACPQASITTFDIKMDFSEDCLTLDLFVPEPKPESAAVMVWIHGGGYLIGAGSIPGGIPTPLAAYGDVIVVTINYRLGSLGFLATGDDVIPANLGLLDQRQALIWVQDNIAAFGGDPNRVTIFGESAGSASVNFHMVATLSAGLFSRAIMQSGAFTPIWTHLSMEGATKRTFDLGKKVGCDVTTSSDLVQCLRQTPLEKFIDVYEDSADISSLSFVRPVADGRFLLDDPIKMAEQGSFNQADVMIGCLADEGTIFAMPAMVGQEGTGPPTFNLSAYRQFLGTSLGTDDPLTIDLASHVYATAEQVVDPNAEYAYSVTAFLGHTMFMCPAFDMAEHLSRAGRRVYSYHISHVPSHSMFGPDYDWLRAAHVEDIAYVFGSPFLHGPDDGYMLRGRFGNEEEVEMSLQMMKYWSNFAKTGDPNLSTKDGNGSDSKYPRWLQSTTLEPSYQDLSPAFQNRAGKPGAKECHFLKYLVPSLKENAAELSRLRALLEERVNADSEKTCDDPESCP